MDSGKIYKIISGSTEKIYIGSTIKSLEERLDRHEDNYENWFNTDFKNSYCSSFEILKYGDYKIELLEDYPCLNRSELLEREGFYQISNYSICVNILIAGKNINFRKMKLQSKYICDCGQTIQNKYKTRRSHSKSDSHKSKIKELHLDMIKTNPIFEISILS